MNLKSLPGRDPQRAVTQFACYSVVSEILSSRESTARELGPHHKDPSLVQALLFATRTLVSVILLIGTMELEQLEFFIRKVALIVLLQGIGDLPSQGVTFCLNFFNVFGGHRS